MLKWQATPRYSLEKVSYKGSHPPNPLSIPALPLSIRHPFCEEITAMFTYLGRFSTRRKAADGAVGDELMALAIAEESDAADEVFAAGRKSAQISEHSRNNASNIS